MKGLRKRRAECGLSAKHESHAYDSRRGSKQCTGVPK